jgi:hypothetical protein
MLTVDVFCLCQLSIKRFFAQVQLNMPPATKTDSEMKKHLLVSEKLVTCNCYISDLVTIFFICHQKPHSLQPNQIYGNLVTNITKS